jgi:hypothetical protein
LKLNFILFFRGHIISYMAIIVANFKGSALTFIIINNLYHGIKNGLNFLVYYIFNGTFKKVVHNYFKN